MTDVAKERAEIDGRRADFMAGAMAHGAGPDWAWAHAQERYPYPKVTRPRVVRFDDRHYRVEGEWITRESGLTSCGWELAVPLWVARDLLARPTEEVEP